MRKIFNSLLLFFSVLLLCSCSITRLSIKKDQKTVSAKAFISYVGQEVMMDYLSPQASPDPILLFKSAGLCRDVVSNFSLERPLTRGEMAGCLRPILGFSNQKATLPPAYRDLNADNPLALDLALLFSYGLVLPLGPDYFGLHENIQGGELITLVEKLKKLRIRNFIQK